MILFKNNITRLLINPKYEVRNYRIGLRKKRVGFKYGFIPVYEKKPAVFYYGDFECFVEDYENQHQYIEDDKVYMVPHVDIYMNDRTYSSTVYFKTVEEMQDYANEIVKDNPYIEI